MAKAKTDPKAKRPHETFMQWRLRVTNMEQEERDRRERIITDETARQGEYVEDTVYHVESGTRVETVRRKSISSLVRMHSTEALSNEQYGAALRIAAVMERIQRGADVACASMEARVDCSRSNRDMLVERLSQVRDEVAYTRWRRLLPLPRRMILDMVAADRPLAVTARKHGVRWERARGMFLDSLDLWIKLRARATKEIDEEDILRAQARGA